MTLLDIVGTTAEGTNHMRWTLDGPTVQLEVHSWSPMHNRCQTAVHSGTPASAARQPPSSVATSCWMRHRYELPRPNTDEGRKNLLPLKAGNFTLHAPQAPAAFGQRATCIHWDSLALGPWGSASGRWESRVRNADGLLSLGTSQPVCAGRYS